MHRSMGSHSGADSLKEADSALHYSRQLPVVPQLGGTVCTFPHRQGFRLACSCAGPMHTVTAAVSSYVQQPCHVQ